MESVIITPKNKKEFEFVTELLTKLKIQNKKLSLTEKEDLGLSLLMRDVDRQKKVSEKIIMKKLKG
ncbi:MAG: hypothetical protein KF763_19690 [Cyclobacteriaceae bacterium]|nr:hypothetical protein [Cyclobacteriaceae bacterium]